MCKSLIIFKKALIIITNGERQGECIKKIIVETQKINAANIHIVPIALDEFCADGKTSAACPDQKFFHIMNNSTMMNLIDGLIVLFYLGISFYSNQYTKLILLT